MMRRLAVLLCVLLSFPAAAAEPTLETYTARAVRAAEKKDRSSFITLNVENDMFGGGTDRNYTNGVRLTYHRLGAEVPAFMHTLDRLVPTFSINETTTIAYSIGHNLYTPKDIRSRAQDPDDRPWAAFLYGSAGLSSITNNHVDNIEATLGIVGPAALGEPLQKFVHKHISDSPRPEGWDNQLENEPGVMLSWERQWPERRLFDTKGWTGAVAPHLGATLGNIYTYANTGVSLRLSPFGTGWQDDPIRVRPAMPGTGAFVVPESTFSWYLFGGIEGRAVARNIFLDGNTFEDSHSVDKKTFVADLSAGIALTYGSVRASYAVVYRTPEFEEADNGGDVFGSLSLGVRF